MQNGYENEREIDLIDILWELLIQWKPMLICGIIAAVIAMVASHARDVNIYNSKLAEYQKNLELSGSAIDAEIEKAKDKLTHSEVIRVENTAYNRDLLARVQRKLAIIQEKGLDTETLDYLTLGYKVKTGGSPAQSVIWLYEDAVSSNSLKQILHDVDAVYDDGLNEIIPVAEVSYPDTQDSTEGMFSISVPLPDGVDASSVESAVSAFVSGDAYDGVDKGMPHELELMYSRVNTTTNAAVQAAITDYKESGIEYMTLIYTNESALTDDQKTLYSYILMKSEANGEESGQAGSSEEIKPVEEPGAPSAKYILIGFVAGCFIYAVALVMLYMLQGRVRTLGEVTDCYMIRGLDEIHQRKIDTAWKKFMYSKGIYAFRFRNADKAIEPHAEAAVKYATELAVHNGLKHVSFIPTYKDEDQDGLCAGYAAGIKSAWDQSALPMDISGTWIADETRDDPGEGEGIVLILRAGDTAFKTLEQIAAYCRDYAVSVVGAILLEG